MKYETKYKLGQKALVSVDCFDEAHQYTHRDTFHGAVDLITIGGKETEYRIIYDDGHQWLNESQVQIISSKDSGAKE